MTYTLMPGKPFEGTEEDTMQSIRKVLTEEIEVEKTEAPAVRRPALSRRVVSAQPAAPEVSPAPAPASPPRRRAEDLPDLAATQSAAEDLRPSASAAQLRRSPSVAARALWSRVSGFRPKTRHLALVSLALLVVVRPHWFVIGFILALALVIGVFMVFGPQRIWGGVLAWILRVEARDAARGARLRTRLDRTACRWDAFLDLFPDGMVDELYMPDFQAMQDGEAHHEKAVADRLDRMVQEG